MFLDGGAAREQFSLVRPTTIPEGGPLLSTLFAGCPVERVETGETLFWQGDTGKDVYEIIEGAMRLVCVLPDGRRVVTGFFFAGELAGISDPRQYINSAEALVPTRIRRCSQPRFASEISRDPDLQYELLTRLRREIVTARQQVVLLACKTAEERVSTFLLAMARRTTGFDAAAGVVHLPMARTDIADYLGLTKETVSRAMTGLRRQGLIVQMNRNTVAVRRPHSLARLAAEDGDVVQDEYSRSNWEELRCSIAKAPNPPLIGASMKSLRCSAAQP